MLRILSPGDLVSDALGLDEGEPRVIFRMFINTVFWGLVGVLGVLAVTL